MEYTIIRSDRKTLALQIRNGELIVRAPRKAKQAEIDAMIEQHRAWIEKHLQKAEERKQTAESAGKLTAEELQELADQALKVIPERVTSC